MTYLKTDRLTDGQMDRGDYIGSPQINRGRKLTSSKSDDLDANNSRLMGVGARGKHTLHSPFSEQAGEGVVTLSGL